MSNRSQIARAIRRREVRAWFGAPASYVFVAAFVLSSAIALFRDEFFRDNQATLDTWNAWFPALLAIFAPLVTMGLWASERRSGTEELLLTLPAKDGQVVLGKYLAAIQIWTLILLFTLPLVLILAFLGNPDPLLIAGNYLGFWLFGVALLGAGLLGSQLSDNLTVAFILGTVFSMLVVMSERGLSMLLGTDATQWVEFLPGGLFAAIGRGVFSPAALIAFIGLALAFGYLNQILLSRRHWQPGESRMVLFRIAGTLSAAVLIAISSPRALREGASTLDLAFFIGGAVLALLALCPYGQADWRRASYHGAIRFLCLLFAMVGFTVGFGLLGRSIDTTSERIHSLSSDSERLISELKTAKEKRPVVIEAYLSKDVPREYARVRRDVRNLLQRYADLGGDAVRVRIVDLDPFSEAAKEAEEKYGITAQTIVAEEETGLKSYEIHMGIAFNSGVRQTVIPFLYEKLSVEYELTRSIRSVAVVSPRKLGILKTAISLFGGFDPAARRPLPKWQIVDELAYQYEVVEVPANTEYPADLNALLVPMASTLVQSDLDRLRDWIAKGGRALLLDDPIPNSAPGNEPINRTIGGETDPMFGLGGAPPQQKGDIRAMLAQFGISWDYEVIASDAYNPHPELMVAKEIVFVGPNSGAKTPVNLTDVATAGLQDLVFVFGGMVTPAQSSDWDFEPLLTTSPDGSATRIDQSRILGTVRRPEQVLAARLRGPKSESGKQGELIFIADLDLISPVFFRLRSQMRGRGPDLTFDNIPFVLNCIDTLMGDQTFVELRKRRPKHRILERITAEDRAYEAAWVAERAKAETEAEDRLAAANKRLQDAIAAIEKDDRLDATSKSIRIEAEREREQARLDAESRRIELDKQRRIAEARRERVLQQRELRERWSLIGWVLSPLLAVAFGLVVLLLRAQEERSIVPQSRRRAVGASS